MKSVVLKGSARRSLLCFPVWFSRGVRYVVFRVDFTVMGDVALLLGICNL
jgi:hypothetical protein